MADGFYIEVQPGQTRQRMELARAVFGRPSRVQEAVRNTMERRGKQRLATKTDPNGKRWQDWAPSTAAERKKEGGVAYKSGPVSLLEHTGAMKRSFYARTVGGVVRVGFDVPYAAAFESGVTPSRKHPGMPARPVLTDGKGGLGQGDSIAVGLAVRRSIEESLDKIFA